MTSNERISPHVKWLREVASHLRAERRTSLANTCEQAADELLAVSRHRDTLLAAHEARQDETTRKPARDADHCDYPDCEQHWLYVASLRRDALGALINAVRNCNIEKPEWDQHMATPLADAYKAIKPRPRELSPVETSAPLTGQARLDEAEKLILRMSGEGYNRAQFYVEKYDLTGERRAEKARGEHD